MSPKDFNNEYNKCMEEKIKFRDYEFTARDLVQCSEGGVRGFMSRVWVMLKTTHFDKKHLLEAAWLNTKNIRIVASQDIGTMETATSPLTNRLKSLKRTGENLITKKNIQTRLDKIERLINYINPEKHGVYILPRGVNILPKPTSESSEKNTDEKQDGIIEKY